MAWVSSWSEFGLYWWQWVIVLLIGFSLFVAGLPEGSTGELLGSAFGAVLWPYATVYLVTRLTRRLRGGHESDES
jgi:hypothetical protein